ncbi:hypothetical protein BA895_15995 [Humibacillus sp. DSM 29435]|nr:hypothetical protein BA895_15995 [Humibacillus sp. DSM 29435]
MFSFAERGPDGILTGEIYVLVRATATPIQPKGPRRRPRRGEADPGAGRGGAPNRPSATK